jgi:hypothetical protein
VPSHSSGPKHLAKPVHAAESAHITAWEWFAVKALSRSHTEVVVIHLMKMIEVMETIDKDKTRAHADEKKGPPIPGVGIRVGRDRVHEHATIWALYDLPCPVRLQARAQVLTAVARCVLRSSRPRGDPCALSGNVAGRVGICGVQADASRNSVFAAATPLLHRGALHRAKRAKHAAIAGIGAQQGSAVAALVKVLAGIRGHGFLLREAAVRTSQHRFENIGTHRGRSLL